MSHRATIEVNCLIGIAPYANLTKRLDISFLPFVGMRIAFKMKKIGSGEENTYRALAMGCRDSTGIIMVESVTYYPEGSAAGEVLRILAEPIAEETESAIAAYVKLMQAFYGFEVEILA